VYPLSPIAVVAKQVVGIMDCQEWKDRNLSEGYEQFVKNLEKV
jgi:hypothetical protein